MKESDIQTMFKNKNKLMGVFELKFVNLSKNKSIAWERVAQHQMDALLRAKHSCLYHKISDSIIFDKRSGARFPSPKPFDCINIKCDSYVVVCFYMPRQYKRLYYIDIDAYSEAWELSKKKSYREEEAKAISCHILEL